MVWVVSQNYQNNKCFRKVVLHARTILSNNHPLAKALSQKLLSLRSARQHLVLAPRAHKTPKRLQRLKQQPLTLQNTATSFNLPQTKSTSRKPTKKSSTTLCTPTTALLRLTFITFNAFHFLHFALNLRVFCGGAFQSALHVLSSLEMSQWPLGRNPQVEIFRKFFNCCLSFFWLVCLPSYLTLFRSSELFSLLDSAFCSRCPSSDLKIVPKTKAPVHSAGLGRGLRVCLEVGILARLVVFRSPKGPKTSFHKVQTFVSCVFDVVFIPSQVLGPSWTPRPFGPQKKQQVHGAEWHSFDPETAVPQRCLRGFRAQCLPHHPWFPWSTVKHKAKHQRPNRAQNGMEWLLSTWEKGLAIPSYRLKGASWAMLSFRLLFLLGFLVEVPFIMLRNSPKLSLLSPSSKA